MTIHYGFLTLAAMDFEKVVNFYQELFQQPAKPYLPLTYAEFQIAGLRLGIFKPKFSHTQEFSSPQGSAFSLCLEVEELTEMIARLQSLGYPPQGKIIQASHGQEIYAYDPEGNRLILHQSYPNSAY